MHHRFQKIETYKELYEIGQSFRSGHLGFVIIMGAPGTGKSETLRRGILRDCPHYEGLLSVVQFHVLHYQNRYENVVFDDVDEILQTPAGVTMFKLLCNSDASKLLVYDKASKVLRDAGVPNRYETKSKVLMLCNTIKTMETNLGAVMDRAQKYLFAPNSGEVHQEVKGWFDDEEIYGWIGDRLRSISQPSMRNYIKAREQKCAGLDWRKFLLNEWDLDLKLAATVEILNDPSLDTKAKRATEFAQRGHGSTATYMRYQQQVVERGLATKPQRVTVRRVPHISTQQAEQHIVASTSAGPSQDDKPSDPAGKLSMPSKQDVLAHFARKDKAMKRMAECFPDERQTAIRKAVHLGRTHEFPIHFDVAITCDGYRYKTQRYTLIDARYVNGCFDTEIYSPQDANTIRTRPGSIPAHIVHECNLP